MANGDPIDLDQAFQEAPPQDSLGAAVDLDQVFGSGSSEPRLGQQIDLDQAFQSQAAQQDTQPEVPGRIDLDEAFAPPPPQNVAEGISRIMNGIYSFAKGAAQPFLVDLPKFQAIYNTFNPFSNVDQMRRLEAGENPFDPASDPFYKFGQRMAEDLDEIFPQNPEYQDEFWATQLPQATGDIVSSALTAVGTQGLGPILLGITSLSSRAYDEAKASGATEEEAFQNWMLNMPLGATEAIPINKMFRRLDTVTGGGVKKVLAKSFAGGAEEMIQEVVQQWGQNAAARVTYDENRDILEGTLESAKVGGGAGFILNALGLSIGRGLRRADLPPVTPEDQADAHLARTDIRDAVEEYEPDLQDIVDWEAYDTQETEFPPEDRAGFLEEPKRSSKLLEDEGPSTDSSRRVIDNAEDLRREISDPAVLISGVSDIEVRDVISFEGNFDELLLNGVHINKSDIQEANFEGTQFNNTIFGQNNYTGSSFKNTTFTGAHSFGDEFHRADFSGSFFEKVLFFNSQMQSTVWKGVKAIASHFYSANLALSDFSGASFKEARFGGSNLRGSNFSGSEMIDSDFSDANFDGAYLTGNFSGSRFDGVDFSKVDIDPTAKWEGADFSKAKNLSEGKKAVLREAGALVDSKRRLGKVKATPYFGKQVVSLVEDIIDLFGIDIDIELVSISDARKGDGITDLSYDAQEEIKRGDYHKPRSWEGLYNPVSSERVMVFLNDVEGTNMQKSNGLGAIETLSHELGHVVERWLRASGKFTNAIADLRKRHTEHIQEIINIPLKDFFLGYRLPKSGLELYEFWLDKAAQQGMTKKEFDALTVADLGKIKDGAEMKDYLLSYDEWFAEQFSKWLATRPADRDVSSRVGKYMKALADHLRKLYDHFFSRELIPPTKSFSDWIEDVMRIRQSEIDPDLAAKFTHPTKGVLFSQKGFEGEKPSQRDLLPQSIKDSLQKAKIHLGLDKLNARAAFRDYRKIISFEGTPRERQTESLKKETEKAFSPIREEMRKRFGNVVRLHFRLNYESQKLTQRGRLLSLTLDPIESPVIDSEGDLIPNAGETSIPLDVPLDEVLFAFDDPDNNSIEFWVRPTVRMNQEIGRFLEGGSPIKPEPPRFLSSSKTPFPTDPPGGGPNVPAPRPAGQPVPQPGATRFFRPRPSFIVNPIDDLNKFQRFLREWLVPEGLVSKEVFDEARKGKAFQGKEAREAHARVREVMNIINDKKGPYKGKLTKDLEAFIDHIMRGSPQDIKRLWAQRPPNITPELMEKLVDARRHIDRLSLSLVQEGWIGGELGVKVASNVGAYLHRQYRVHVDPNWARNVPHVVRERAKSFIRGRYEAAAGRRLTEREVSNVIDQLLYNDEFQKDLLLGTKLSQFDAGILRSRKGVPAEIRALWGEIRSPLYNYMESVRKISQLLGDMRSVSRIRDIGEGQLFFRQGEFFHPQGYNHTISAGLESPLAPLAGWKTHPEILASLKRALEINDEVQSAWVKGYLKVNGLAKLSKTVLSPITHARNFFGGSLFLAANGIGLVAAAKHGTRVWKTLTDLGVNDRKLRYADLDLLDQSVAAGELDDVLRDMNVDWDKKEFMENFDLYNQRWKQVRSKYVKAPLSKAIRLYQFEDNILRITMFEAELARQMKARFPDGAEPHEVQVLEEEVAATIRDTYPNYSKVPRAIKSLRRNVLVGPFVSFPYEAIRTTVSSMKLAKQEIKHSNPAVRRIGYLRMFSVLATVGSGVAITLASAASQGISDETEDDINKLLPPWDKNGPKWYLGFGEGKVQYVNIGYTMPHTILTRPILTMMTTDEEEPVTRAMGESLVQFFSEFTGTELTTQALLEIYANEKKSGAWVTNPEAPLGQRMADWFAHMWDTFEPGIVRDFVSKPIKEGEEFDVESEVMASLFGLRRMELDVEKSFSFKARDFNRSRRNARALATGVLRRSDATEEEKREAIRTAQKRYEEMWDDMQGLYDSAFRLGLDARDLDKTLEDAGIGKALRRNLLRGRFEPMNIDPRAYEN